MSVVRRHNARTWCAMAFFGLALAGGTWLAAISQQPGSANAPGAAASNSKYVVASAPDNYDEIVASARNSWPIDLATVGCLSVSERSSIFHKNYYDDHRIVTILQEQFPGKSVNRKNDACRFALDFNIIKTTVRAVKYQGEPAVMLLSFGVCPRESGGRILANGCSSKDLYLFRSDLDPLEAFEIGLKAFDQRQEDQWMLLKIPN